MSVPGLGLCCLHFHHKFTSLGPLSLWCMQRLLVLKISLQVNCCNVEVRKISLALYGFNIQLNLLGLALDNFQSKGHQRSRFFKELFCNNLLIFFKGIFFANIHQLSYTQNFNIHCVIQSLSAFIVLPSPVNCHTQICEDDNKYYTHSHNFVSQLHRKMVVILPDVDIP